MKIGKVVLAGDFHHDRLGASWERGLHANGVEVLRFNVPDHLKKLHFLLKNRILHRLTLRSYWLRHWASREYNQTLQKFVEASGTKILLIHNGDFIFPDTIEKIQAAGTRCVLYHADNPLPPHYANRPETLPVAKLMDKYCVWSDALVNELKVNGVRNACFLPFAWDEKVFPFLPPDGDIWLGVIFIGGWDADREAFLNQIASKVPLKIYGPNYWGERTRSNSLARKCWQGAELSGQQAAQVIRNSAICLNILRNQHIIEGKPDGLIMRHFEVPGAGGFLLSTRSGGATRLFAEGETAEYFSNADECLKKINHYLAHQEKRSKIVDAGHKSVAEHHSYTDRMGDLMELLK